MKSSFYATRSGACSVVLMLLFLALGLASCSSRDLLVSRRHIVTFDTQSGVVIPATPITSGKTVKRPLPPTREGYIFVDWVSDAAGSKPFDFKAPITANTTIYAQWTPAYIVAFDSQDGTTVRSITVAPGNTAGEPTTPVRNGYVFEGWHSDSKLEKEFDFTTNPITANITLYAKWTLTSYNVVFNTYGGTAIQNQVVEWGKTATQPIVDPKKSEGLFMESDIEFSGWFADTGFKTPFDFKKTIKSNDTLYARYTYLISTEAQLREVGNQLFSRLYKLQNDIILAADWTPIGSIAMPFIGHFDGQGHAIKNLNIKSTISSENTGLFGVVGVGGVVQAVGVEVGGISGGTNVGALAGYNFGRLTGYATGYTMNNMVSGSLRVGGLVGRNSSEGTVIGYTAALTVSGERSVGGLVGNNAGAVTGYTVSQVLGSFFSGGLVGANLATGTLTGYSRSDVTRNSQSAELSFGLMVGDNANTNVDAIKSYCSHDHEAFLKHLTDAELDSRPGEAIDGDECIEYGASIKPIENSFSLFTFGTAPGQWTWLDDHWPSINLETPVDQSKITEPAVAPTP